MSALPASAIGTARLDVNAVGRAIPLVPRNTAIAILSGYRKVISPMYGDVCAYYPSCSAYSVTAMQQHGFAKGSWLTLKRLGRCHPWARGGEDDVPAGKNFRYDLTRKGYVVPAPRERRDP